MKFPPFPKNPQEIFDFPGRGEYMACAIVRRTDARQLMSFRKLRLQLGEQDFREALVEGLDIISHSTGIKNPSGWLYWFVHEEACYAK